MQAQGNIKNIQQYNKKHVQPDAEFEFLDSIITAIIHADPESNAKLSIVGNKVTMHITPSIPEFKQSIINNLIKQNSLLKIKIVFSSSLKISKGVSFSITL